MLNENIRIALLLLLPLTALPAQEETEKPQEPEKPTAAVEIAEAVATAKAHNKRALIAFLGDDALSRDLDGALRKDRTLSRQLRYEFAVARADAGTDRALAAEWDVDLDELGTPALLVLDGDRHLLAKLNRNAFWSEQKGFEPATLGGMLELLHAEPLDAEKLLAAALVTCQKTDRNLLLHFDAPW